MAVDHETLLAMLTRLKLTAIRDGLDTLLDEAARRDLTLREAIALLCEREVARKDERRIAMALKIAHFPCARELDGFDFAAQPSLDAHQIRVRESPIARQPGCRRRNPSTGRRGSHPIAEIRALIERVDLIQAAATEICPIVGRDCKLERRPLMESRHLHREP